MKKFKLLTHILGLSAVAGIVAPISSCSGGETPVDPTIKPTGITVTPDLLSLTVGETKQLSAKVSPADASQEVEWSSSNENVAIVDANGNVKGISNGETQIIVKPKGYDIPGVCVVKVNQVGESKFICEQSQKSTERGQTACWYIFDLEGGDQIPNDLVVAFDKTYEEFNKQILKQIVPGTDNKQLRVGIQGVLKYVDPTPTKDFKFVFKSEKLGLNQSIDCSYTYLKSMIRANGERNTEKASGVQEVTETFNFVHTDGKTYGERNMEVTPINIAQTDGLNAELASVKLTKADDTLGVTIKFITDGTFKPDQWINFDLEFKDNNNGWTQVIRNYSFNILDVKWNSYSFNKQTEVVVDWKGDKQNALKVVDGADKGILPKGTAVGTPFEISFDLSTWPETWYQPNQWKFGSYKHPTETHVEYYCFSSISVWVDDGSDMKQLEQTEPADHEGVNGLWWVSSGGPITVLYNKVKEKHPDVKSIVYRVRTADPIEFDSSFYVTYA